MKHIILFLAVVSAGASFVFFCCSGRFRGELDRSDLRGRWWVMSTAVELRGSCGRPGGTLAYGCARIVIRRLDRMPSKKSAGNSYAYGAAQGGQARENNAALGLVNNLHVRQKEQGNQANHQQGKFSSGQASGSWEVA
jgi:hypothetical protein